MPASLKKSPRLLNQRRCFARRFDRGTMSKPNISQLMSVPGTPGVMVQPIEPLGGAPDGPEVPPSDIDDEPSDELPSAS